MSGALETVIADLCAKHDLTGISVGFSTRLSEGVCWHSYAHWRDSSGHCGGGNGANASEAIANAIKDAAAIRSERVSVPAIDLALAEREAA